MAHNDITGDKLISKVNTKEYEEGYERIFSKNFLCSICGKELATVTECAWTSCEKWLQESKRTLNDVTPEEWDEARINIIGQNGNDALHYKQDNLPINEYPDNSKEEAS